MKIVKFQLFLILAVMLTALVVPGTVAQYGEGVTEHCDTPTEEVTVVAAPSGEDTDLSFNTTEIEVPKATCVEIIFINKAPTVEHDFVIDPVPGDDGINFVDIHLLNSTDHGGEKHFNILTPDADSSFTYYCSILDHQDEGMEGTLIVGSGTSAAAPGFTFFFAGMAFVVAAVIFRTKRA